eukprot:537781_1
MAVEMKIEEMISTKDLIQQIEEKYADVDEVIDDHTTALFIEAMGGIKRVMIETLKYPILNDKHLTQIQQVLSTPKQYQQQMKYQQHAKIEKINTIEEMDRNDSMILYLIMHQISIRNRGKLFMGKRFLSCLRCL